MSKEQTQPASLLYIFLTFLKLGTVSFGGYMALIAMVQKQVVEIDKKLKEEDVLDGVSLTSVLPGAQAVNVIAYLGYRMRGIAGAMAAFTGIILPSFLLVVLLSWTYCTYGNIPAVKNLFYGIIPLVTALIAHTAWKMGKKNLDNIPSWIICGISTLMLILVGGYATTAALILASGCAGFFLFKGKTQTTVDSPDTESANFKLKLVITAIILVFLIMIAAILHAIMKGHPEVNNLNVCSVFTGASLTLLGGGYVVIPALHELFVENLQWMNSNTFADGIAIGQITPGPIFISATFIGYKLTGITGAICATIAMFTPPAVLTVSLSQFVPALKKSTAIKAILKGIHAAVIGMIVASVLMIGKTMEPSWISAAILALSLALMSKYNISPALLILASGIAGLLLF